MGRGQRRQVLEDIDRKIDEILGILNTPAEEPEQEEAPVPQNMHKSNRDGVPKDIGEVLWIGVHDLVKVWMKSQFGQMRPPSKNFGVQSFLSLDSKYAALTEAQANKILQDTKVDDVVWQENKVDCDNISRYMASRVSVLYRLNSIGVVDAIDEAHSYCVFILHDNGRVYLRAFEPQTDQWRDNVSPKQGWIHFG